MTEFKHRDWRRWAFEHSMRLGFAADAIEQRDWLEAMHVLREVELALDLAQQHVAKLAKPDRVSWEAIGKATGYTGTGAYRRYGAPRRRVTARPAEGIDAK